MTARPKAMQAHAGADAARWELAWLYLLIAVPMLTDVIETGRLPRSPREWLTEVVAGAVIAALVHKVRATHLAVIAMARSDPLTGLGNRRAFDEAVADDCVRAHRSGQALSLVCIDLDNFKQINDRHGHAAGDRVLQQFASAVDAVIRTRIDRAFRLGGDEFALLLPASHAHQAEAVLARIAEHCALTDPVWADGDVGISAGIVELDRAEPVAEFVKRADAAMYAIKRAAQ